MTEGLYSGRTDGSTLWDGGIDMNGKRNPRKARGYRQSRRLMIAFALVLLIGVVGQIALMARLSHQNKRLLAVQAEAAELSNRIDNLNLSLSQFHDHNRIRSKAQQLGMRLPDETQLRVVNLPGLVRDTSAQSVENTDAGEMMQ